MADPVVLVPDLLWLDGRFEAGKAVCIHDDGTLGDIVAAPTDGHDVLALPDRAVVPGFINAHSHAFQRLIRGRTQRRASEDGREDFWSWRESMYGAALRLSAGEVHDVARWCFVEMMRTGITAVGEFHYLHHQRDGAPYPEASELAHQILAAAEAVGIRIVLLNVCYAAGGIGRGLVARQRRFRAESLEAFLARTGALLEHARGRPLASVGLAPHSVRAVPREWLAELHAFAARRALPLHMHVSEQTAEVEASVAAFGLRPIELLAAEGVLDSRFTAVHATHVSDREITLMAAAGASVCACPTTERDLGDGFLRGLDLVEGGVPICLGTDSHTSLDFFAEMRLVEYHERLRRRERVVIAEEGPGGGLSVGRPLLEMATSAGARSLGLPTGAIAPGRPADLVAIGLDHPSLLGIPPADLAAGLALSATPDVVRDVWVDGVRRIEDGRHALEDDAASAFRRIAGRL